MTVVDGEGQGSVVETHATPVAPGVTRLIEATLAASPRREFRVALALKPLVARVIERAAARLWRDDIAYAERTFALRQRQAERAGTRLEIVGSGARTDANGT
jgi:hypothetical protein